MEEALETGMAKDREKMISRISLNNVRNRVCDGKLPTTTTQTIKTRKPPTSKVLFSVSVQLGFFCILMVLYPLFVAEQM